MAEARSTADLFSSPQNPALRAARKSGDIPTRTQSAAAMRAFHSSAASIHEPEFAGHSLARPQSVNETKRVPVQAAAASALFQTSADDVFSYLGEPQVTALTTANGGGSSLYAAPGEQHWLQQQQQQGQQQQHHYLQADQQLGNQVFGGALVYTSGGAAYNDVPSPHMPHFPASSDYPAPSAGVAYDGGSTGAEFFDQYGTNQQYQQHGASYQPADYAGTTSGYSALGTGGYSTMSTSVAAYSRESADSSGHYGETYAVGQAEKYYTEAEAPPSTNTSYDYSADAHAPPFKTKLSHDYFTDAHAPRSTNMSSYDYSASLYAPSSTTKSSYDYSADPSAFFDSPSDSAAIEPEGVKYEELQFQSKVGDTSSDACQYSGGQTVQAGVDHSLPIGSSPSGYDSEGWQPGATVGESQLEQNDVQLVAEVTEDVRNEAEPTRIAHLSVNQPPAFNADYGSDTSTGYFYDPNTGQYHTMHPVSAPLEPRVDWGTLQVPTRSYTPAFQNPRKLLPGFQASAHSLSSSTNLEQEMLADLDRMAAPPASEDPLNRKNGCPIVTFGFGGKVCLMFPRTVSRFNAESSVSGPMTKVYPGDMVVTWLSSLVSRVKVGAPENRGPLPLDGSRSIRDKRRKETIECAKQKAKEENEMAALARDEDVRRGHAARSALWKVLAAITEEGAGGKWGVAARQILLEEDPPKAASPTGTRGSVDSGKAQAAVPQPITLAVLGTKKPDAVTPETYAALEQCLLDGDRAMAVQIAARHDLWAQALLISSCVSRELFAKTTGRFIRNTLVDPSEGLCADGHRWDGLRILYGLMGGMGPLAVDELLDPPRKPTEVDVADDAAAEELERRLRESAAGIKQGEDQAKLKIASAAAKGVQENAVDDGGNFIEASALISKSEMFSEAAEKERVDAELRSQERKVQALQRWKKDVALILANRPTDSASITAFGDILRKAGLIDAAHVCYLLSLPTSIIGGVGNPKSRIVLVGADHLSTKSFYKDPDALLRSEILEFALTFPANSGSSKDRDTPVAAGVIPHLQAYKVAHAWKLFECGLLVEAMRYCEASLAAVRTGASKLGHDAAPSSPYYNGAFLHALRELHDRITKSELVSNKDVAAAHGDAQGGWLGSLMQKPTFDSFLDVLDRGLSKIVAGEDERAEQAAEPGESSAIIGSTLSRPGSRAEPIRQGPAHFAPLQRSQTMPAQSSRVGFASGASKTAADSTQAYQQKQQQNGAPWVSQQSQPAAPPTTDTQQSLRYSQQQERKQWPGYRPPAQPHPQISRSKSPLQQSCHRSDTQLSQPDSTGPISQPVMYPVTQAANPPLYSASQPMYATSEPVYAAVQPAPTTLFNPYGNAQSADGHGTALQEPANSHGSWGSGQQTYDWAGQNNLYGQSMASGAHADGVAEAEEDLGFGNTALRKSATERSPTAESDGTARDTKSQDASPSESADRPDDSKSQLSYLGLLKSLWPVAKRKSDDSSSTSSGGGIKANLGEKSSFYYDEELKRWVNKADPSSAQPATPPPPPPSAVQSPVMSRSGSGTWSAGSPPTSLGRESPTVGVPPTTSGPPSVRGMSASGRSTPVSSGGRKRPVRSRYVDLGPDLSSQ